MAFKMPALKSPDLLDKSVSESPQRAPEAVKSRRLLVPLAVSLWLSVSVCSVVWLATRQIQTTSQLTQIEETLTLLRKEMHEIIEIEKADGVSGLDENDAMTSDKTRKPESTFFRYRRRTTRQTTGNANACVTQVDLQRRLLREAERTSHPSVHLTLMTNSEGLMQHGANEAFQWCNTYRNWYNYSHNELFEMESENTRFVVQYPGTYFVYAKVTFNGRNRNEEVSGHVCSYQVILDSPATGDRPRTERTLLYGSVTQFKLGQPIFTDPQGDQIRAQDSVYEAAVFKLYPNDRLLLRPDLYSRYCRVLPHPEKTFFGAFRLNGFGSG